MTVVVVTTVVVHGNSGDGDGALSVVQAHCSSDTKQSAYKVAAAFAAEKAKPRRAGGGGNEMVHRDRRKKRKREREGDRGGRGGRKESERITVVSEGGYCLHRANQNQPFQHTLPLSSVAHQRTHTRARARFRLNMEGGGWKRR